MKLRMKKKKETNKKSMNKTSQDTKTILKDKVKETKSILNVIISIFVCPFVLYKRNRRNCFDRSYTLRNAFFFSFKSFQ